MSHQVEKRPIPIPSPDDPDTSLKIQAEIVHILDSCTERLEERYVLEDINREMYEKFAAKFRQERTEVALVQQPGRENYRI